MEAKAKIIQVDITADELGKNGDDTSLSLVGDVGLVVETIGDQLSGWKWQGESTPFYRTLQAAKSKNEEKVSKEASSDKVPMTYEKVFGIIQKTFNSLSRAEDGDVVYVSEGANAMDISRSIFTMEQPRVGLDAGTYATMGVGMAHAIAAHAAYNFPHPEGLAGKPGRKKIVAIEGDSAFGFSAMEVETMARYQMDFLIFVINNGGLYRGDSATNEGWLERQKVVVAGGPADGVGLSATSLGYETNYQKTAEFSGVIGIVARTPEELKNATEEGYRANVQAVVNVIVDAQADLVMVSIFRTCAPSLCLNNCILAVRYQPRMLTRRRTSHGSTSPSKKKDTKL